MSGGIKMKACQLWCTPFAAAGGAALATVLSIHAASAAVTINENFGQFCTATFGSTADPACQGANPAALQTFSQQCTAAGGQFQPGSDPTSPLFGNEARCIAAGAQPGTLRDQLRASFFIGEVEEQFDY